MTKDGLSKEEIIKKFESKLSDDCDFRSGLILGSMCTEPLQFAREIFAKYCHINIGDKGISPCANNFEIQLIGELASLYHGNKIVGNFTSGGTEGNIIAMRIARKVKPSIRKPEIIVSESAHLSFEKLSDLIGVKVIRAKLSKNLTVDPNDVRKKVNENTCGLVGIAGTTGLGLIDPIEELSEIAEEKDLYLHVDAAFGGFVIPFMEDLGYTIPNWDFRLDGVNSITADPHKMGMGIIPAGTFLIKNDEILEELQFQVPYLAGGAFDHFNLTGTRPGAAVIAFWATWKYLGFEGYKNIVKNCLDNTTYLKKRIEEIDGIKLKKEPRLNVIGITHSDNKDVSELNKKITKKGWKLGEFKRLNFLRIVCMPHVKKEHIDHFCADLELITKKMK